MFSEDFKPGIAIQSSDQYCVCVCGQKYSENQKLWEMPLFYFIAKYDLIWVIWL